MENLTGFNFDLDRLADMGEALVPAETTAREIRGGTSGGGSQFWATYALQIQASFLLHGYAGSFETDLGELDGKSTAERTQRMLVKALKKLADSGWKIVCAWDDDRKIMITDVIAAPRAAETAREKYLADAATPAKK